MILLHCRKVGIGTTWKGLDGMEWMFGNRKIALAPAPKWSPFLQMWLRNEIELRIAKRKAKYVVLGGVREGVVRVRQCDE